MVNKDLKDFRHKLTRKEKTNIPLRWRPFTRNMLEVTFAVKCRDNHANMQEKKMSTDNINTCNPLIIVSKT